MEDTNFISSVRVDISRVSAATEWGIDLNTRRLKSNEDMIFHILSED